MITAIKILRKIYVYPNSERATGFSNKEVKLPSVKKSRGAKNESVLLSKSHSVQYQRKDQNFLPYYRELN